ncbi:4233_t:CDS:2, partial [Funneliformis caledonium]
LMSDNLDINLALIGVVGNGSDSGFGKCPDCGKERISDRCENLNLDNLIRYTQLNANGSIDYLEYIDFKRFDLIENTNKGDAFSNIYSAIWMEGPRWIWDEMADQWIRNGPIRVFLKKLNNSQIISTDYLNQLYKCQRCLHGGSVADLFELSDQFDLAEEKKFSNLESNGFYQERIHHEAFYTSRLLYFPE